MAKHQFLFATAATLLLATPAWGRSVGGLTFRLSLHPDLQGVTEDEEESEVETEGSTTETDASVSETSGTMSESLINLGAGYTFPFGLHLGASFWQSTSKVDFTISGGDPDDPDGGAEFKSTTKTTATAIGPTLGFVHESGMSAFFTPFTTMSSKSEDSSEFSAGSWTDDDEEPVVTDDSKTTGYRLDLAYHFQLGQFEIGPELSYMVTTTKVDVTTVETDTSTVTGEPSTTTTHESGTSRYSRIVPMIGMAVVL